MDRAEQQNQLALVRSNGGIQAAQKQNYEEPDLLTCGDKRLAPPFVLAITAGGFYTHRPSHSESAFNVLTRRSEP